jgi:CRP/FNR family transcriptional regulator, cyclic AMP receptor protein
MAHGMKQKRDVKVERLRGVGLFAGCSDQQLGKIAQLADEIAVPKDYVLVYEGDYGDEVFVIAEGEAEVTNGSRKAAALGPGSVVGELAVLDSGPRSATVTASSAMRFFVFERRAFAALLEDFPIIARRMMSGMAQRLRETQGQPV